MNALLRFCSILQVMLTIRVLSSIILLQPSNAWVMMAPVTIGKRSSNSVLLSHSHTTTTATTTATATTRRMTEMTQPSFKLHNNNIPSYCFIPATTTTTHTRRCKTFALWSTRLLARRRDDNDDDDDDSYNNNSNNNPVLSPLLQDTSKSLRRISFLSWWGQVILTTVSAVILVFARNVLSKRDAALSVNDPSFFLSGSGLILSAVSILWTWGNGARLSRRLIRRDKPMHRYQAANMLRRAIQVGVTLNLAGLLVHLLAAEEIVGSLAIQVLTTRGAWEVGGGFPYPVGPGGGSYLQPLDVLIVQANTNALLSHFCSLVSLLFLTKNVKKLDPPSDVEEGATVRQ